MRNSKSETANRNLKLEIANGNPKLEIRNFTGEVGDAGLGAAEILINCRQRTRFLQLVAGVFYSSDWRTS
jgi:hypothetical protein